jgi:hypothetical protein
MCSGVVEGNVNRPKTLKWQMFSRAELPYFLYCAGAFFFPESRTLVGGVFCCLAPWVTTSTSPGVKTGGTNWMEWALAVVCGDDRTS